MIPFLPHLRYERKFVLQGWTFAHALAIVRRHPAGFCEVFPPRVVNNMYLDTPTLQAFHDHVNGISLRKKTRVRWYGLRNGDVTSPVLELKLKHGLVSGKLSHPSHAFSWDREDARARLHMSLKDFAVPEAVRADLRYLAPSLWNCYSRHYFKSMDGRFRLTIDSNLQFKSPESALTRSDRFSVSHPAIVIELKFEPQHAEEAEFLGQHLPIRAARCSKYVLGIQRLHEAQ